MLIADFSKEIQKLILNRAFLITVTQVNGLEGNQYNIASICCFLSI
jgi:hypothetical protein